jgi:hypothetical protein
MAALGIFVGIVLAAGLIALSVAAFVDHPVPQTPWPDQAGEIR